MLERVHLVGNSSILLESRMGKEIDSYPVFRINSAPTSGYEEDVGSRTDARIICGSLQKGISQDEPWLSTISGETLILYPTKEATRKNAQWLAGADNSLRYLRSGGLEAWRKFGRQSPLEAYPTSGLYGAWFLSQVAKQVHLYGFGFFRISKPYCYWKDIESQPTGHDPETEKKILESMSGVTIEMEIPDKNNETDVSCTNFDKNRPTRK